MKVVEVFKKCKIVCQFCPRSGRGGSTVSMLEDVSGYGYVDERVLIKSFEALANALGFKKKSFSTNDILGIEGSSEPVR